MEILHVGVQTKPNFRKNVALDINDKMEDNILKRLQTEYLFINHICFALVKELFL